MKMKKETVRITKKLILDIIKYEEDRVFNFFKQKMLKLEKENVVSNWINKNGLNNFFWCQDGYYDWIEEIIEKITQKKLKPAEERSQLEEDMITALLQIMNAAINELYADRWKRKKDEDAITLVCIIQDLSEQSVKEYFAKTKNFRKESIRSMKEDITNAIRWAKEAKEEAANESKKETV